MHTHFTFKSPSRQKGLALVILIVVIALAYISYFFSELSIPDIKYKQDVKTMAALKKAKQALLAYAMNYPDTPTAINVGNDSQGPGNFVCPDADQDGDSDTTTLNPACNSGGPGTIGRFPWAEIGVSELRDGSGELLWYAVSSNYTNFANGNINTSTVGEITVRNTDGSIRINGVPPSINGVVAVIIAPGQGLVRDDGLVQSRTTAAERNDPKNYLDIAFGEDNAAYTNSNTDGFILGVVRNALNDVIVNDQIEIITYEDIMPLIHARAFSDIRDVLVNYQNPINCGAYPDASLFDPTKADADFDSGPSPTYKGHIPTDDIVTPEPATVTPADWNTGCAVGISLPDWFVGEDWHKETYYEFSPTLSPCLVGDCLVVNNSEPPVNDAEAIIVFSGRDLNATRQVNNLLEYLEDENADGDEIYDEAVVEDYVGVVAQ